ncbi:MAG TPA: hypothetical protein VKE98_00945 [Gemmataceae bacterium]|nr:hypothetical protein [Gemmataceae bacterium]
MKMKTIILAVIACCCCGFFFWYRALRPASATAGLFPMTLTGVNVETCGHSFLVGPRVDIYGVKTRDGNTFAYLVAQNLLVSDYGFSYVSLTATATVAVDPIQAYRLMIAQKEGSLSLTLSGPPHQELPKFSLEEFLQGIDLEP